VRPPKAEGTIYERYFPLIGMTFSLRTVDPEGDADVFSGWMNLDRVAYFGTRRVHVPSMPPILAERRDDPHMHPMIGYFDDKPLVISSFIGQRKTGSVRSTMRVILIAVCIF